MLEELLSKVLRMCPREINITLQSPDDINTVSEFIHNNANIVWSQGTALQGPDISPSKDSITCSLLADGILFNFTCPQPEYIVHLSPGYVDSCTKNK
jgi:hypothetical protein